MMITLPRRNAVLSATLLALLFAACGGKVDIQADAKRDTIAPVDTTWPYTRDSVVRETVVVKVPDTSRGRTPAPSGDTARPGRTVVGNIRVTTPHPGQTVGMQFELAGESRTFENSAAYRLIDSARRELSAGHFTAVGPMGVFSRYSTIVRLVRGYRGRALLEVFEYSAKDGSEINKVRVPLRAEAAPMPAPNPPPVVPPPPGPPATSVQAFFPNVRQAGSDCSRVFPITRPIAPTTAVADAALRELLRGPSPTDTQRGYISQIPAGVTLRSVTIVNGVATADFSRGLDALAGSCAVIAARAQIERTLRQFASVSRVIITVEGRSTGVLQP